ncbi:MAG: type I methionyl aminopeptidase [Chloroflexi bacterium]|nr:MAG: type I methionyl aminopeptidase [Phototrophicales bacterium]RMF82431.1 MAG: type I methionyl aminopeptidase [Chloroflexota bacterium]
MSQNGRDDRGPHIKSAEEVAIMREAGRIVARAHEAMREMIQPGVTTAQLDAVAETVIRDHGAIPAFLNYPKKDSPNFPASITASINNELVHGIPSKNRVLQEGDIISLDTGAIYQGFVGDAAYTYPVGDVPPAVQRLLKVTEEALYVGIEASVLPNHTKDVCLAIHRFVAEHGYDVAREYTGHGVGRRMHEEPQVPNWWPSRRMARKMKWVSYPLQVGMTYALEPMVIAGRAETDELDDKWTVVTKDGSLCAHFEHTIAITEGEPVILTLP